MANSNDKNRLLQEKILHAQTMQRRWRKLQNFARDIYRSELTDPQVDALVHQIRIRMVTGGSGPAVTSFDDDPVIS